MVVIIPLEIIMYILLFIQEQLLHSNAEIENLRKENHTQKELLIGSSKTLSGIKNKYDIGLTSWNEERLTLEKKLQEVFNIEIYRGDGIEVCMSKTMVALGWLLHSGVLTIEVDDSLIVVQ